MYVMCTYHMSEMNNYSITEILDNFISDYGVPDNFKFDITLLQTGSKTSFNQLDHIIEYINISMHISGLIKIKLSR